MRISDWSSDVCSSDLETVHLYGEIEGPVDDAVASEQQQQSLGLHEGWRKERQQGDQAQQTLRRHVRSMHGIGEAVGEHDRHGRGHDRYGEGIAENLHRAARSEEHTSELQSLMRSSYAVFCLKKKKN